MLFASLTLFSLLLYQSFVIRWPEKQKTNNLLDPRTIMGWPVILTIAVLAIVGQIFDGFVRKIAWVIVALLALTTAWREIFSDS